MSSRGPSHSVNCKKVVFLCSGGGGNLRFVKRSIEIGVLPALELAGVIADRECHALRYAAAANIPHFQTAYTRDSPHQLRNALADIKPDVVVTNIHKILDRDTVAMHAGRLVNLHYSLLPAFKGLIGAKPVERALQLQCKIIGTTAHHVSADVDAGEIISQSALIVGQENAFHVVMDKIFRGGCINLANAIDRVSTGMRQQVAEPAFAFAGASFISPAPRFTTELFTEEFLAQRPIGHP